MKEGFSEESCSFRAMEIRDFLGKVLPFGIIAYFEHLWNTSTF